ncbi:MAG: hypothetical protein WC058_10125 [Phycisphaeraceae bacterium]
MGRRPTGEEYITLYNARDQVQQLQVYDPVAAVTVTRANYYYDGDKNLISQTDANGDSVVKLREYDGQNHVTRRVDALDNYTLYRYDDLGNPTRQLTFDSGHTAMAGVDYAYDAANRVTSERLLSSPAWTGTSNQDVVTAYIYDGVNRITKTRKTLYGNDGGETVAESISTYDAAGRLLTQTQSDAPTVAYAYDLAGNMTLQSTDPSGLALTTSRQYDSVGRATRSTQPDSTYQVSLYDAFGQVTKSIAYDTSGGRLAVTGQFYDDHLGVVTRSYQISSPASTDTFNSTNDPYSDALYTAAGRLTKTIDPLSHATTYDYDGLGRRITTTDPIGNKVVPLYDNADRLMTQVRLDYDGTNYTTFKTAYEYDPRNQVTKTIDQGPDGDITAATDNLASTQWYDALGQVTQTQDPAGQQTAYLFDKLGQLTRTTEDSGGGGVARYTDRGYDRAGRLTRLTGYPVSTSNPQNTDYAYNKAGVQTRVTWPDDAVGDRGYTEMFYDAVLRLTKFTDQAGLDSTFAYDSMGRRLTATRGTQIDSFAYNAIGSLTTAQRGASGNLDSISRVDRLYDGQLRLTRESQSIRESTARNVDYTYDKGANLLTLTYPSGIHVEHTYDANDRQTLIQRDGVTIAAYRYVGPGARVSRMIYETGTNDVTLAPAYDGVARMTRQPWSSNSTDLVAFNYVYDQADNVLTRTFDHRDSDPAEAYGYDRLHRLTRTVYGQKASTPYEGYVYDGLSNRLTLDNNGTPTAAMFNAVNEMTKHGAPGSEIAVEYSKTGNLTKNSGSYHFFYDRTHQLTRIEDASNNAVASYAYDALGRRIERVDEKASTTLRFYHTGQRVIEDTDTSGGGAVQRHYIWGNYIDELLLMRDVAGVGGAANEDLVVLRDERFSPTALVKRSDGSIVERYEHDAFGKTNFLNADFTVKGTQQSSFGLRYAYTGRELDILDIGGFAIMYFQGRYYDPATGTFYQRDPAGYPDGMNAYAGYFAMWGRIDPFGTAVEVPIAVSVVVVRAAAAVSTATAALILAQQQGNSDTIRAAADALENARQQLRTAIFIVSEGRQQDNQATASAAAAVAAARELAQKAEQQLKNAMHDLENKLRGKGPCDAAKAILNNLQGKVRGAQKTIAEHQGKIRNPTEHMTRCPHTPEEIAIAIADWTATIAAQQGNIDVLNVAINVAKKAVETACGGK